MSCIPRFDRSRSCVNLADYRVGCGLLWEHGDGRETQGSMEGGAARVKAEPEEEHERATRGVVVGFEPWSACADPVMGDAVLVKQEAVDLQDGIMVKRETSDLQVAVKQELYIDHEVHEELVLGPVGLQTRTPNSKIQVATVSMKLEPKPADEAPVQEEPGRESETEQRQQPDKRRWPTLTIGPIGVSWPAPRKPPAECHVCHKQFKKAFRLKEHMRTHTGDKPYRCDMCGKCFAQSSTLTKHERIHTGAKPYVCEICYKDFALSESLTRHRRTHTGEKPYVCEICNEKFTNSGNMKEHKQIHTVGKPHSCGICKKHFARAGTLKVHERIHTGEKPYSCAICNKEFAQLSNLKKHKLIHKEKNSPV